MKYFIFVILIITTPAVLWAVLSKFSDSAVLIVFRKNPFVTYTGDYFQDIFIYFGYGFAIYLLFIALPMLLNELFYRGPNIYNFLWYKIFNIVISLTVVIITFNHPMKMISIDASESVPKFKQAIIIMIISFIYPNISDFFAKKLKIYPYAPIKEELF